MIGLRGPFTVCHCPLPVASVGSMQLLFPTGDASKPYSLLGLGDIVIPGQGCNLTHPLSQLLLPLRFLLRSQLLLLLLGGRYLLSESLLRYFFFCSTV